MYAMYKGQPVFGVIGGGGIRPVSLAVTAPPSKTDYLAGDLFDPAGMVVTATYSNGDTAAVTAFSYLPTGPLTEGDAAITVKYMEQGITLTAQQPIQVGTWPTFGVFWSGANAAAALTRLTADSDPNGLVTVDVAQEPSPAVGDGNGSSPFDSYAPWKDIEEYNVVDGAVSHKRGDAEFSRTDYDTMVYIPEFWYKITESGENRYFYISSGARSGFAKHPGSGKYVGRYNTGSGYVSKSGLAPMTGISRSTARTGSAGKGAKWGQYDFAAWNAVWLLYLVEFADWDSQAKIGRGNVDASSIQANGGTDSMTYHTGRAAGTDGKTAVQYRHIENPWGNVLEWIDGANFSDRKAYISTNRTNYADDTTENYTDAGVTLPVANGWIKGLGLSEELPWAFLPDADGGSAATFVPDAVNSSTGWKVLMVGGHSSNGSNAGLFCFNASLISSYSSGTIGARLLFYPEV